MSATGASPLQARRPLRDAGAAGCCWALAIRLLWACCPLSGGSLHPCCRLAAGLLGCCCPLPADRQLTGNCQAAALLQPKTGSVIRPGFGALRFGQRQNSRGSAGTGWHLFRTRAPDANGGDPIGSTNGCEHPGGSMLCLCYVYAMAMLRPFTAFSDCRRVSRPCLRRTATRGKSPPVERRRRPRIAPVRLALRGPFRSSRPRFRQL